VRGQNGRGIANSGTAETVLSFGPRRAGAAPRRSSRSGS
jgi:hypothetical protein